MPCSHRSITARCVKKVINIGGPLAQIHPRDSGVMKRLQDLLVAKGSEGSNRRAEGYQPRQTLRAWLAEVTTLRAKARGFSGYRDGVAPRWRAARHSTPHAPPGFSREGHEAFSPWSLGSGLHCRHGACCGRDQCLPEGDAEC